MLCVLLMTSQAQMINDGLTQTKLRTKNPLIRKAIREPILGLKVLSRWLDQTEPICGDVLVNLLERVADEKMIYREEVLNQIDSWAEDRLISEEQRLECLKGI